jgi:hypothetical protein
MTDYLGRPVPDLWGADGPSCPDGECSPVDVSIPFGHVADCPLCPHVRCAICGAWAEAGDPDELAAAWPRAQVAGQTAWLD